jgi:hypothetical protein
LFSSYDIIDSVFKWKPPIFFLDSDSPFNCLNASIKILLPYIRKFLRKKKVGKNKFYNEQKQTFAARCIILGYFQIIISSSLLSSHTLCSWRSSSEEVRSDWERIRHTLLISLLPLLLSFPLITAFLFFSAIFSFF